MRRCLGCKKLTRGTRCDDCRLALKRQRNADARAWGPAPQTAKCHICGEYGARVNDPIVWDHRTPLVDQGRLGLPAHKSCNESKGKRR